MQETENMKLSEEVKQNMVELDMKINARLKDIAGTYPDTVSLLTKIGQQFF